MSNGNVVSFEQAMKKSRRDKIQEYREQCRSQCIEYYHGVKTTEKSARDRVIEKARELDW